MSPVIASQGFRSTLPFRPGAPRCISPERLSLADWKRIGEQIFLISNSSSWWLGDWLVYGQDKFPDRYRIAISEAKLDYQTLRNHAWVARKFPLSRRRDTLSFQHHLEVAALPEADQDIWLERAACFKWSKAEAQETAQGRM